jgi:hypothetical protein
VSERLYQLRRETLSEIARALHDGGRISVEELHAILSGSASAPERKLADDEDTAALVLRSCRRSECTAGTRPQGRVRFRGTAARSSSSVTRRCWIRSLLRFSPPLGQPARTLGPWGRVLGTNFIQAVAGDARRSQRDPTKDGAFMEPSRRNHWQVPADRPAAETAETGQICCRGLRLIAAGVKW